MSSTMSSAFRELIISPLDYWDDGRAINVASSEAISHNTVASSANSFGSAFVYQLDHPLAKKRFIQWFVNIFPL